MAGETLFYVARVEHRAGMRTLHLYAVSPADAELLRKKEAEIRELERQGRKGWEDIKFLKGKPEEASTEAAAETAIRISLARDSVENILGKYGGKPTHMGCTAEKVGQGSIITKEMLLSLAPAPVQKKAKVG